MQKQEVEEQPSMGKELHMAEYNGYYMVGVAENEVEKVDGDLDTIPWKQL